MRMAINAAEQFVGATSPNPPVGAVALDAKGKIILGAGHARAGEAHAEAKLLQLAEQMGKITEIETIVVTLEPCNHQGKTGPCTAAILKHKNIRRVVYGALDPNPSVAGGGAEFLKKAGLEVIGPCLEEECQFLIRGFAKNVLEGQPWVTMKAVFDEKNSMIPPTGAKTFSSPEALTFAHELRKRADAIWTGSGTILADNPEFTVRHIPDHPKRKPRYLVISDRRGRVLDSYKKAAEQRGFELLFPASLEEGLEILGKKGVLEVLVEGGPMLRQAFLESGLWDEDVVIKKNSTEEEIEVRFREETDVHGTH